MGKPTQKQIDAHSDRVIKKMQKKIGSADFDICAELRKLAKMQPKRETVLLPMCNVSDWWNVEIEPDYEPVKISKLLQFIADMIE